MIRTPDIPGLPPGPLPPAGYIRVSLFVLGAVSDAAQKDEITTDARRRGLPEPVWYMDVDRTASDERKPRPDFNRLMADVIAGTVKVIICRSSDRFVRRPRELETIIDILSPRNVPVFFVRDSDYDLSTAGGRENARIKGAIARGEVERMSERMQSSSAQRAKQGIPRKGNRPFGYQFGKTDDGVLTFVQVPAEADAIRDARRYLAKGGTLAEVARRWNKLDLLTGHGKAGRGWTWFGVKQAMLNPAVGGFRYYIPTSIFKPNAGKRLQPWEADLIPGNWADISILTDEQWKDLRTLLTSTRQKAGNRKRHLGSGVYLCGVCDDGTTLRASRHSRDNALTYRCRANTHMSVFGAELDIWVLEMLRRALVDADTFEASFGVDPEDDPAVWEAEKAEAQKGLDELAESFGRKGISISAYENASKRLEAEVAELDQKLSTVRVRSTRRVRLMSFDAVDDVLRLADLPQRRQLLADIFPTVTVSSPGRGGVFTPEQHVKMIDRSGRVWPTWFLDAAEQRSQNAEYWLDLWKREGPADLDVYRGASPSTSTVAG